MTTGLATPENTALTDRPGCVPLPTASMTRRSGVPSSTSPTSGATTSPTTVATIVPGDSAVPIERNQSAPRARMCGTLASVSTLLTSVGFGPPPRPARPGVGFPSQLGSGGEQAVLVGREPARQRRLALDDLEHRLLLAEQVLVGAGDDGDLQSVQMPADWNSCTARVTASISRSKLRLRQMKTSSAPMANAAMMTPFDELVGVGAQQGAVLERARLALGAVAHEIAAGPGLARRCLPTCDRSGIHLRRGRGARRRARRRSSPRDRSAGRVRSRAHRCRWPGRRRAS